MVVALYSYFNGKPPLTKTPFLIALYTLDYYHISQAHYVLPIQAAIPLIEGRVTCTHPIAIPIAFWNQMCIVLSKL